MQPLFRSRRDRLDQLRRQREGGRRGRRPPLPRSRPAAARPAPAAVRSAPTRIWSGLNMSAPHCGYHLPIGAYLQLSLLLDPFTFRELWPGLTAPNALEFPGYEEKLSSQREKDRPV